MTSEEFVEAIRKAVLISAVDSVMSGIEHPPGRKPRDYLVSANAWYRTLSEQERAQLRAIAMIVSHQAVFGFLCVLDNVRVIDNAPDTGAFELVFRRHGKRWLLNPPDGEPMHDILTYEP